jgi:hypothetical protein
MLQGQHAQAGQHRLKAGQQNQQRSSEEPSWKRSLGVLQDSGHEGAKTKTAVERRQINARCELNRRLVWTQGSVLHE